MSVALVSVSVVIAVWSAPGPDTALTAEAMNIKVERDVTDDLPPPQQPGEWLEYSPLLTILIVLLAAGWLIPEFATKETMIAISSLNTLQLPLHHARHAAALAAEAISQRGRKIRSGDVWGADPVSVLRIHCSHSYDGEK